MTKSLQGRHQPEALYRALRLLTRLVPEDGPVLVELAHVAETQGAWPEALTLYRQIAGRFAGRREGQIAELKAIELESRTRTLN